MTIKIVNGKKTIIDKIVVGTPIRRVNQSVSQLVLSGSTGASGLDSADVLQLITDTVDTTYVQSRVTLDGVGLDSASVTSLIDSDYIQARQLTTASEAGAIAKTYYYDGTLETTVGSLRLYVSGATTLATIDGYVTTAPQGADVTAQIMKNGTSIGNVTIAATTTGVQDVAFGTAFVKGDYITVNITSVGATTAGENLYLNFNFA